MKTRLFKICLIYILCIIVMGSFTGCDYVHDLEKTKIVTACHASYNGEYVSYSFYVSVPSGSDGDKSGSNTAQSEIYTFSAYDFKDALSLFKDKVSAEVDLSHMSLFATDQSYIDLIYTDDSVNIKHTLTQSPYMYYCITGNDYNKLFECITGQFSGNAGEFTKFLFENENAYLACSSTELLFSADNKYYTSVIPVINIEDNNSALVPSLNGAYIYSRTSGTSFLDGEDYNVYKICRNHLYKDHNLYEIELKENRMEIRIKDESDKGARIADFANRYASMGFDPLNCIYFSKEKFVTYSIYEGYIGNIMHQDMHFYVRGDNS